MIKTHRIENILRANDIYFEDTETGEFFKPGFRKPKKKILVENIFSNILYKGGTNE